MSRLARCALLSTIALGGCSDLLLDEERVPTSIELESRTVTVTEGEPVPLRVRVLDQDGEPFERVPAWAAPVWSFAHADRVAERDGEIVALGPGATTGTVAVAGLSATATVRVNPRALGLTVEAAYVTQSVQTLNGTVPLVRDRDAFLRVFLRGDRLNFFRPGVRVHLYGNGTLLQTLDLQPGGDSIPTSVQERNLTGSWNAMIPARLVQPGLSLVVEADPGRVVPLATGSRLRFPAAGTMALDVRSVPKFFLRLIPVNQTLHATTGRVSEGNKATFVADLLAMFPIAEHDIDVRTPYSTSTSATPANGSGWSTILSELLALQTAEGSRRYYYGLLTHPGGNNIAGIGYIGLPAALGYDALPGGVGTLAHELGHNFGRRHAPCGNPNSPDPLFPYANGGIGAFGYHVSARVLKDPALEKDLMSYCSPEWISDYTYRAVLQFRRERESTVLGGGSTDVAESVAEPSLLVWGRVGGGTAVLEPAFEITTRPSLPAEDGPYRVEGLDASGAVLFSLSFRGAPLAEVNTEERHFAFAIPERLAHTDRLARLRLVGPGVRVERRPGDPSAAPVAPAASLRRPARGEVRLEWADEGQPMALVRDAQTREILSFARDGGVALRTPASRLEVLFSDGVRTTRRTLRVQ